MICLRNCHYHIDFNKLIKYCKKINIKFLASVFDISSFNYLRKNLEL